MSFEGVSEKSKSSSHNEGIKFGDSKKITELVMREFRQNNVNRRNELARKSSGWNVNKENSLVQASFKLAGYDIGSHGIDGIIGKDTKDAIGKFQKAMGLNNNGELDSKTRSALERVTEFGLDVRQIEKRVKLTIDKKTLKLSEQKVEKHKPSKSLFQHAIDAWANWRATKEADTKATVKPESKNGERLDRINRKVNLKETKVKVPIDVEKMKTVYIEFKRLHRDQDKITPIIVKNFAKDRLTDAERLYLAAMIAHDNTNFNPETIGGTSVTWCNAYAAYTLWLFNDSKALMQPGSDPSKFDNFRDPFVSNRSAYWTLPTITDEKNAKGEKYLDIRDVLTGDKFKEVASINDANKLALEGKFVVGFTLGHILIILGCLEKPIEANYRVARGVDEFKPGLAVAVGQQGNSNLLYGVSVKGGTTVNAYLHPDYTKVKYYVLK